MFGARTPAAAALVLIVTGAAALALHWVFLVPIYQSPDEVVVFDYMLSLEQRGWLYTVRDGPDGLGHPWTQYLADVTGVERIAFHANVPEVPGYGTRAYYERVDRQAPSATQPTGQIPFLVSRYPFAYFALEALWMAAVGVFAGRGPVELFFASRAFNVLLLAASLLTSYGAFRELRLSRPRSLLLTAAAGFFPVVTFVSAYDQIDNLGFTLVAASCWLALRARRRLGPGVPGPETAALGLALGLLVVTKYQFWACAALAVVACLGAEAAFRRLPGRAAMAGTALLLAPSVALWGVQYWIDLGSRYPLLFHTPAAPGIWSDYAIRQAWHQGGLAGLAVFAVDGVRSLLVNLYGAEGDSFRGFWGTFGWMDTPLVMRSARIDHLVRALAQLLSIAALVLLLVRIEQTLTRLARVARRGRGRWALRIAFGNPLLTSLYAFAAFMAVFYVYADNTFFAQGRNWLPWIPTLFMVATWYAPRALAWRRAWLPVGSAVLVLLLLYSAAGSYYAERDVRARYYGNGRTVAAVDPAGLPEEGADHFASAVDYVDAGPLSTFKVRPTVEGDYGPTSSVAVEGFAVDLDARAPARAVFVVVDGSRRVQAVTGDSRPDGRTGFDLVFYVGDLAPGTHRLTFEAVSADGRRLAELPEQVEFERP